MFFLHQMLTLLSFGFKPEYSAKCKPVSADTQAWEVEHCLHKDETPKASAKVVTLNVNMT